MSLELPSWLSVNHWSIPFHDDVAKKCKRPRKKCSPSTVNCADVIAWQSNERISSLITEVDESIAPCNYCVKHGLASCPTIPFDLLGIFRELHEFSSPVTVTKLRLALERTEALHIEYCLMRLLSMGTFTADVRRMQQLVQVVKMIMKQVPEKTAWLCRKSMDSTPLHVAIRNYRGFPPIVIEMLSYDETHQYRMLRTRDTAGNLPLHVACEAGVNDEIMHLLLDKMLAMTDRSHGITRCNALIWSANDDGYSPIDLCWIRHLEIAKRPLPCARHGGETCPRTHRQRLLYRSLLEKTVGQIMSSWHQTRNGQKKEHIANAMLNDVTCRIFALIQAATGDKPCTQPEKFILHKACSLSGPYIPSIPFPILKLILWLHPEQVSAKDSFGRFPLHYASGIVHRFDKGKTECSNDWVQWVRLLCKTHQEACSASDYCGRLPLHYLLDSDSALSDVAVRECDRVVRDLVTYCPQSVESRDIVSTLYPFMMAASNQLVSLDTTYEILRLSPSVLEHRHLTCFSANMSLLGHK